VVTQVEIATEKWLDADRANGRPLPQLLVPIVQA
jgi:hypothetical protein